MAEVTRVVPVEWLEGHVNDNGTKVIVSDGTEYHVPYREQEGLKDDERVKFVPQRIRRRGKLWTSKVIPML